MTQYHRTLASPFENNSIFFIFELSK
jgi:hypothetical protein